MYRNVYAGKRILLKYLTDTNDRIQRIYVHLKKGRKSNEFYQFNFALEELRN